MITKHENIISCYEVNVFGNLKTTICKILRHLNECLKVKIELFFDG